MKTASEEVTDMIFLSKWSSQTLCAGAELGVFDCLSREGARTASDVAAGTGLDPRLLRLELTESVLVENEATAARCLHRLRQLGLKIAIDDFGTGYSSLSYLHRMPIDLLKIDASFVQTMVTDEKNRRIVETILALGKNLGVDVIAEGVETAQQAQVLTRLGCCYVQGHLFSEAVDEDAAARLLESDTPFTQASVKMLA